MEGALDNRNHHRRRTGGRQAAEHAGQRTRGRPVGRRLARHSTLSTTNHGLKTVPHHAPAA